MLRVRTWVAASVIGVACLLVPIAQSQPGGNKAKLAPKLEPVAETKLIMEGLAGANLRGLAKLLQDKPVEAEAWGFARGQALLIAETGNLLLLRPPRSPDGQDVWLGHAADLREAATGLARAAAAKDYIRSRSGLAAVANVCNRCHQSFRVGVRVDPFTGE